ncbi:hypothetical protein ACN28S_21240 [Cystobacter fuscus]
MERLFARRKTPACALVALLALTACPSKPEPTPDPTHPGPVDPPPPEQAIDQPLEPLPDWPRVQSTFPRDEEMEKRIDAIVSAMTLEEKVGQMTQPEIKSITPEEVRDFHIGSVLNGGGARPMGTRPRPSRTGRRWPTSTGRPRWTRRPTPSRSPSPGERTRCTATTT